MTISKNLLTDSSRPDGKYAVCIVISLQNIKRMVNTNVYVDEGAWDAAANAISEVDPDYVIKNEMIESFYRRVVGKLQAYMDNALATGIDKALASFNPSVADEKTSGVSFLDVVMMKARSSRSINTRRSYECLQRYMLDRLPQTASADNLNLDFSQDFQTVVDNDVKLGETTRQLLLTKFNAVVRYGKEYGYFTSCRNVRLPLKHRSISDRNLSDRELGVIFAAYAEAASSDSKFSQNTTIALGLFVLDIAFQGLAPVDLANLKVESVKVERIYNDRFKSARYSNDNANHDLSDMSADSLEIANISTCRTKTGQPVRIVSSTLGIAPFLEWLMSGKSPHDYLLPCYNINKEYTPSQRQDKLANYFYKMACCLNQAIGDYCRLHGQSEMRRVTFYFARHAFCNLVDSLDIPRHYIQGMIGHRSTVLDNNYIRPLSPWEQATISHTVLRRYFSDKE